MKNTFKIVIFMLLVLISSCSKDDSNQESSEIESSKPKLSSLTAIQNTNTYALSFVYNNMGKWISGSSYNQNYTISYTPNGTISFYEKEGSSSSDVTYLYDSSDQLNKIIYDTYEVDFVYSNGKMVGLNLFDTDLIAYIDLAYNENDLIETITNSNELIRYTFTYDHLNRIVRVDEASVNMTGDEYVNTYYRIYTYENHKNPVYELLHPTFGTKQITFSPLNILPETQKIFQNSETLDMFIFSEYHVKSIKRYHISSDTTVLNNFECQYTLENNLVTSLTINYSDSYNTQSSQTIHYRYQVP
ncbi:MAG: hypothetical protein CMC55_00940 [Flavobacteriaceae bacterium]|uniref:hypothetical protein n=1 Tax=Bizionia echini TaxID=649333 RepID=UPI000C96D1B5|nr:hypothetical protein [Flavobacteriaceae bacterium]